MSLKIKMPKEIREKFNSYPPKPRAQLLKVRDLVFEVATEEELGDVVETLKWGEPSYASKKGSPIRMDWKEKAPNQISIFFNCKTTLIETFKELHGDTFEFSGNREISLPISTAIPKSKLKQCFSQALRYHKIKLLHLLGA